jgi:hypothetical protein
VEHALLTVDTTTTTAFTSRTTSAKTMSQVPEPGHCLTAKMSHHTRSVPSYTSAKLAAAATRSPHVPPQEWDMKMSARPTFAAAAMEGRWT